MDTLNTFVTVASIIPERPWGIDIPNYFWFTGCSAAAFIVSSFAHVFGMKKFKPIAGFSLLLAFVLLLAAPLNLIDDLRQPGRLVNFFLYGWENFFTSPMKWGVLLLAAYPLLILAEALVLYRLLLLDRLEQAPGAFARRLYRVLTLGRSDRSEAALRQDERIGFILGAAGIPLALAVHGYTGYILGVVHSIPMWHTPLMPILFLASAMVSGTGLLLVLLPLAQKYFTDLERVDGELMTALTRLLGWSILIDLAIRFFWLTFAIPFNGAERFPLLAFFRENLLEVVAVEYVLCLLMPLAVAFSRLGSRRTWQVGAGLIAAAGVWLFRWNTVIGGQAIGKSTPGLLEYQPHLFGSGSLTAVLANWGVFAALLCAVLLIFPWDTEMQRHYRKD
jgi:tetrathionate reductase subunit C